MPPFAAGKFEAAVTGGGAGEGTELARASFFYFPLFNFGFLFAGALGVGLLGGHLSGLRKAHPAWWLISPVIVGLAPFVLWPSAPESLILLFLTQMLSLSAFLTAILSFHSGTRWMTLLKAYVPMAFLSMILLQLAAYTGRSIPLKLLAMWGVIVSVPWFLQAAIATCLLRGRFSVGRLCLRTAICWPTVSAAGPILLRPFLPGHSLTVTVLAIGCAMQMAESLCFLLGFLLLVSLNRWYRTRFMQVLGLSEATVPAAAASGAARDLPRPGGEPPSAL
jgi:hypothetical protein